VIFGEHNRHVSDQRARKVAQLRHKLSELRKKLAKTTGDVAANRKKAAEHRTAATKARNPSTAANKTRQAEKSEAKANAAEQERAKLESQIARRDSELVRAIRELERQQSNDEKLARRRDEARVKALEDRLRQEQQTASQLVGVDQQPTEAEWDFFVSHSSTDKDTIVRPLAELLRAREARVWFDEFELRVGDDLRARIDDGLANSRFGVVVLSTSFLSGRHWTDNELSGLFANQTRILPIWHHVSHDEVAAYSAMLAGRVALLTATKSLEQIAKELLDILPT